MVNTGAGKHYLLIRCRAKPTTMNKKPKSREEDRMIVDSPDALESLSLCCDPSVLFQVVVSRSLGVRTLRILNLLQTIPVLNGTLKS